MHHQHRAARRALLVVVVLVLVGVVAVTGLARRLDHAGAKSGRDAGTAKGERSQSERARSASGKDSQRRSSVLLPTSANLLGADDLPPPPRGAQWRSVRTSDNTAGSGRNTACQQERFADPKGYAARVRLFRAGGTGRAAQTVEVSRTRTAALRTFRTTLGWWTGCQQPRLQLLSAEKATGVGDQAQLLTFRAWHRPAKTVSLAIARTGAVTTSTVVSVPRTAEARWSRRSLTASVAALCGRGPDPAPRCVAQISWRRIPPPAARGPKGFLDVVDLPPVGRVDRPWVATPPRRTAGKAVVDGTVTPCDNSRFEAAKQRRTRSYVIPQAGLATRFGLSQTVAGFGSPRAAQRFVATVRDRVNACEKRNLAAHTSAEQRRRLDQGESSAWRVAVRASKKETVRFRLALVRVRGQVSLLTFTPTTGADMTEQGFRALVDRTGERLRELR